MDQGKRDSESYWRITARGLIYGLAVSAGLHVPTIIEMIQRLWGHAQ